jgi:hypothetical protein
VIIPRHSTCKNLQDLVWTYTKGIHHYASMQAALGWKWPKSIEEFDEDTKDFDTRHKDNLGSKETQNYKD